MKNQILKITDRLIHWVFTFSLIAVPLYYVYGKGENYFFSIYDVNKYVLIQSVALILLGLFSLRILLDKSFRIKLTPLYFPFLFFFGMMLVSFFQVQNYFEAMVDLKQWLSFYAVMLVVFHYVNTKKQVFVYLNWMILVATVFTFYGLLQIFGIDFPFLVQNFKGNATDGNPNFAGEYMTLIFPLTIWLMVGNIGKKRSYFYLLAVLIIGMFILLNRTKAAWVGLLAATLLTGAYLAYRYFTGSLRFHITNAQQQVFQWVLKVTVGFVVILFLVGGLSFVPAIKKMSPAIATIQDRADRVLTEFLEFKTANRLFQPQSRIPESDIRIGDTTMQRVLIWQNTWRLIKDHPVFGVGLGNFKIAFQPYRTRKEQLATGPEVFVRQTHNDHWQNLAEFGPIGSLAFFLILFRICLLAEAALFRTKRFEEQCLLIGFVMSFLAFMITATFGFPLHTPNPSFTCWTLAALFAGFHWYLWHQDKLKSIPVRFYSGKLPMWFQNMTDQIRRIGGVRSLQQDSMALSPVARKILSPVFVLLIVAALTLHPWVWKPASAFYNRQFGQALQRMGLHEKAAILFKKSLRDEPEAWETLFLYANESATMNQFDRAIEFHQKSLYYNPYHAKGHYNLANSLQKLGRDEEATRHYELAIQYDDMLYQGYSNLGAMFFKRREYEKSIEYYKKSLAIDPGFFSAYYNIAYTYVGLGRIGEAIPYLKKAKDISPDNVKIAELEKRIVKTVQNARIVQMQQKLPQSGMASPSQDKRLVPLLVQSGNNS